MNQLKTLSTLAVVLLSMVASAPALAHGGGHRHGPRVSVGFVFSGPAFWYYPPPYYYNPYYPRVVAVPAEPTVYIERGDSYTPPEQSHGYWYYCPEAKAYYPYVKQCAGGWQRVNPQPPGG